MPAAAAGAAPLSGIWGKGDPYERYVGRWSRVVAREFLAWLAVPAGREWVDVGSGTGALSQTVRSLAAPRTLTGVDRAFGFVAHARGAVDARFVVGDAAALPFGDASFDVAVSGLVLNFVPQPADAVAQLHRVLRPGGTAAAYVWDYAGEMQMMRRFWETAAAFDPVARDISEGMRFALCAPEPLREAFELAGFTRVEVRAIDIPTVFADFDDYWEPFLGGQGPAPAYVVSLDDARRVALRERLRLALRPGPDGRIELIARAWAVRGLRA